RRLADQAGCSPAQLALAWLLHRAAHVIPIPGTTSLAHLQDNMGAARVALDAAMLTRLDALINPASVSGARYNAAAQADSDTEEPGAS
ncbi:MAG TPA: aldo/keto reductase, partial [Steroidobacteraceae bacterium]